jgi:hypothetical protein
VPKFRLNPQGNISPTEFGGQMMKAILRFVAITAGALPLTVTAADLPLRPGPADKGVKTTRANSPSVVRARVAASEIAAVSHIPIITLPKSLQPRRPPAGSPL